MHHVDSPWIESIVFVTFWNRFSKEDSRESPEMAPAPAAMSGGVGIGGVGTGGVGTGGVRYHSKKQLS